MRSGITVLRLRYLHAVREICGKDSMGFAIPTDVEAKMELKPNVAKAMLKRLLDMGLLERPYRGCYRLADEGKKIMKEVEE